MIAEPADVSSKGKSHLLTALPIGRLGQSDKCSAEEDLIQTTIATFTGLVAFPPTPAADPEDCNPLDNLLKAPQEEAEEEELSSFCCGSGDCENDSDISEPISALLSSSSANSSASASPKLKAFSPVIYTPQSLRAAIALSSESGERRLLVVLDRKVYDLTRFAKNHPGGPLVIEHMAGKDATDAFTAFHPPSVWKTLPGFYAGEWSEDFIAPPLISIDCIDELTNEEAVAVDNSFPIDHLSADTRAAELKSKRISQNFGLLNQKLRQMGFYEPNPWFYYRRFALFAALFTAALYTIMSAPDNLWRLSIGGVLLGFVWHGISFSVHDLAHHSGLGSSKTDHTVAVFLASFFGGLSAGWWGYNHNTHHVVTNDVHHDPDIQHMPFFAISSRFFNNLYSSFHKRIMKFDLMSRIFTSVQHYSFIPILTFGRFNLYAQSIGFLIANPIRNPYRWLELGGIAVFWAWFGYGILYSVIPTWPLRLFLLYVTHAATFVLHLQITLSHFAMSTADAPPHETFAELGVRTTMNVDCPWWMDWFHGGLQFQVEHHLFPRIPRSRLRSLAPLVQTFCKENDLPYYSYGFFKGNGLVRDVMREVADQVKLLWQSAKVDARYKTK